MTRPPARRSRGLAILLVVMILPAGYALMPGDPNLGELADLALESGDLVLADSLYSRWLDAAPDDEIAWYNHACTLALLERKEDALQAFQDAVTAGWRNADWPPQDPDLSLLHENSVFVKTIDRIQELKLRETEEPGTEGILRHAKQTRMAPYRLIRPTGKVKSGSPSPLVVLLHGRGKDMGSMAELPQRIALPGITYLIPRAPYPDLDHRGGFEYWPFEADLLADSTLLEESRALLNDWLLSLIDKLAAEGSVDSSRIVVAGHCQGGAAALLLAQQAPGRFLGVAELSGSSPRTLLDEVDFSPFTENGISLLLAHGLDNQTILAEEMRELASMARIASVNVREEYYPIGHEITDEMIVDFADWLRQQLNRKTSP